MSSWKGMVMMGLGIALSGCTATDMAAKPTAGSEQIKHAQQELNQYEYINVQDDGYIEIEQSAGYGYQWKTSVIKQISEEYACEQMYPLIEQGFVVVVTFKGKGGRIEAFDQARCESI
jgi:hypothetical protein